MHEPRATASMIDYQHAIVNTERHIRQREIGCGLARHMLDASRKIIGEKADRATAEWQGRSSGARFEMLARQGERVGARNPCTTTADDLRLLAARKQRRPWQPRSNIIAPTALGSVAAVEENEPRLMCQQMQSGRRIRHVVYFDNARQAVQRVIHASFATATAGAAVETSSANTPSAPTKASNR